MKLIERVADFLASDEIANIFAIITLIGIIAQVIRAVL